MKFVHSLYMILMIFEVAAAASAGPRARLKVDGQLRMNVLRFSPDGFAHLSDGRIDGDRYYPEGYYSVGIMGTSNCSNLLDHVQAFPLAAMAQTNYISPETLERLKHSESYLQGDQVTFANVYRTVDRSNYDQLRDKILPEQLTLTPARDFPNAPHVPVTMATMYLANGYRIAPGGMERARLPWESNPAYKDVAPAIIAQGAGLDYEIGRALQVEAGTAELALKAMLISVAHEAALLHADFHKARIFIHSGRKSNTALYLKRMPSLKVVASDPADPDSVVLMTTLAGIYSQEFPWDLAGPVQSLRDVNRDNISVVNAVNLLSGIQAIARADFDYHNAQGEMTRAPIQILDNSGNYDLVVNAMADWVGIETQDEKDAVIDVLNGPARMTENVSMSSRFVDEATADSVFLRENAQRGVVISNLDPRESKVDPRYELRVLMGSLFAYHSILEAGKVQADHLVRQVVYTVATSNPEIQERLNALGPTLVGQARTRPNWNIGSNQGQISLNYRDVPVRFYTFSPRRIGDLAHENEDLFRALQRNPSLRPGYFRHQRYRTNMPGF